MKAGMAAGSATLLLAVGSAQAMEPWRVIEAPKAGLRLEAPRSWRLRELALCDGAERPRMVVLVRLSSGPVEPPLSETADLEIYVHPMENGPPLARWLQGEHGAPMGRASEPREAILAGRPALARTLYPEGDMPMNEVFAIWDRKALHVTAPVRPGLELAVQHALDTLDLRAAGWNGEAGSEPAPTATHSKRLGSVRPLLLVPADVTPRPDYRLVLTKTFQHLQAWFLRAMGGGATFGLADSRVLKSRQTASWFANNAAGSDPAYRFFRNGAAEAFALTGGSYDDPVNRWIIYVDADQNCGDSGGKSSQGVAVMPRNDLRGLTNQAVRPRCGETCPPATPCRWIGGAGHELGHALGLPHPSGCEDKADATACPDTVMWAGYASYPDTVLTAAEKTLLGESSFFAAFDLDRPVYDCRKLFAPPRAR